MITALDHQRAIQIQRTAPFITQRAHPLVPQYALEPAPRLVGSGDTSPVSQAFDDNLSNLYQIYADLRARMDRATLDLECNVDGTLSGSINWHDDDEEEEV